jgi:hypothetical protein
MQLRVCTDFGDYVVPEPVRGRIWDKLRDDGQPDRRFALAPVIDRYYRVVAARMQRLWDGAG